MSALDTKLCVPVFQQVYLIFNILPIIKIISYEKRLVNDKSVKIIFFLINAVCAKSLYRVLNVAFRGIFAVYNFCRVAYDYRMVGNVKVYI